MVNKEVVSTLVLTGERHDTSRAMTTSNPVYLL